MLLQDNELEILDAALVLRLSMLKERGPLAGFEFAETSAVLDKIRAEKRERRAEWSNGRLI